MADRKQFLGVEPADPKLLRLLEESKDVVVTDEMLREQRVSFAFGNAPHSREVSKESVRQASRSMRLRA
jgi:hypothetical protein